MIVAPFSLGLRPRVLARAARATRAALPVRGALPDSWQADLGTVGAATVSIAGVTSLGALGTTSGPVLAVRSGAAVGRLSVDPALGSRLVDAALGGKDAPSVVRALGPAERGVLAGLLVRLFEPIRWGVSLEPGPAPDPDLGAIVLRIETPVGVGNLDLQMPTFGGGDADGARAHHHEVLAARLWRLPVDARVEVATTRLRAVEIAAAEAGGAVVFDGPRRRGALSIGSDGEGGQWPVELGADGTVVIAGSFEHRTRENSMNDPGNTEDVALTAALAAAPIEVVAELGRITLRGEELAGLAPGTVLALGTSPSSVSLRVGAELWAEGEIVDVEGELGVRITRLKRR